jgi:hypothetical protein
MTTQDQTDDSVSRVAHDRMTKERDELKALLTDAQGELSKVALERRAYEYFKGQKVPNAVELSQLAAPHLKDVDPDAIGEKLGALFPASMVTPQVTPTDDPPTEPETPAPAVPPVPAIGGPDPGAPGTPPPREKVKINSPEMKARIATEGFGAVRDAIANDEVTFHPSNEHAQRIAQRGRV